MKSKYDKSPVTLKIGNLPKVMVDTILARACIGLRAAGLNVEFDDLELKLKVEKEMLRIKSSFDIDPCFTKALTIILEE